MRDFILNGELPLPSKDKFLAHFPEDFVSIMESMWHSLWVNYCAKTQGTSTIHWLEVVGTKHKRNYLSALKGLQNAGWIIINTRDNYSSAVLSESKLLEFVSAEELSQVRFEKRFIKYLPFASTSNQNGLATVRVNGKATDRKLPRVGMEVGAKSVFSYDRNAMVRDYDLVRTECRKGIEKTLVKHPQMAHDEANYGEVMDSILEYIATTNIECNMGTNHVDSRGRAIKTNLDKVMNPVGYKVARALLVIPA
jgi:hypothetical protein